MASPQRLCGCFFHTAWRFGRALAGVATQIECSTSVALASAALPALETARRSSISFGLCGQPLQHHIVEVYVLSHRRNAVGDFDGSQHCQISSLLALPDVQLHHCGRSTDHTSSCGALLHHHLPLGVCGAAHNWFVYQTYRSFFLDQGVISVSYCTKTGTNGARVKCR